MLTIFWTPWFTEKWETEHTLLQMAMKEMLKLSLAEVTENQLQVCLPLTFPASSLIMLFLLTSHHEPPGLHPAPPTTDTLHKLDHLPASTTLPLKIL